ncbi:Zinc finger, C3HC4 type (RING finger) [Salvia divinorum]|uniref:Zinc finger, C3HC4 type (RING finger) n=1 Tax=Salvia divinorum TaxID=28513 RepID=A0ABD1IIT4_SALDI
MGLQNHLSDLASESILIIMTTLLAKTVAYLHSLILSFLHNLGLERHFVSSLGDQLAINRGCSYPSHQDPDADCAVCLNRLARGDHVRTLACRHVFHKDCFDGWLRHLNFNCPLCRAPVVSDDCWIGSHLAARE